MLLTSNRICRSVTGPSAARALIARCSTTWRTTCQSTCRAAEAHFACSACSCKRRMARATSSATIAESSTYSPARRKALRIMRLSCRCFSDFWQHLNPSGRQMDSRRLPILATLDTFKRRKSHRLCPTARCGLRTYNIRTRRMCQLSCLWAWLRRRNIYNPLTRSNFTTARTSRARAP